MKVGGQLHAEVTLQSGKKGGLKSVQWLGYRLDDRGIKVLIFGSGKN